MRVLLADLILFLHLGYVAFVVVGLALVLLGGPLGWAFVRSPKFRLTHLAAIGIVAAEGLAGVVCPLTVWEARLRIAAGQTVEDLGLVSRLAFDLLYIEIDPLALTPYYVGFFLLVLASFWLVPVRWAGRDRAAG
jgi:hypothetical protein